MDIVQVQRRLAFCVLHWTHSWRLQIKSAPVPGSGAERAAGSGSSHVCAALARRPACAQWILERHGFRACRWSAPRTACDGRQTSARHCLYLMRQKATSALLSWQFTLSRLDNCVLIVISQQGKATKRIESVSCLMLFAWASQPSSACRLRLNFKLYIRIFCPLLDCSGSSVRRRRVKLAASVCCHGRNARQ